MLRQHKPTALFSKLNALGIPGPVFELLRKCLYRWSRAPGKGIPQGYSASDLLAKLYFASADQSLVNLGYAHVRYVDDIRIFCRTHLEARCSLIDLTDILHNLGLTLQAAKTQILTAEKARLRFDGIQPTITKFNQLKDQFEEHLIDRDPYISADKIEELLEEHADEISAETFEQVFRDRFLNDASDKFDKTLFHYLLSRLGKVNSKIASDYCIDTISRRPEEMKYILKYLGTIDVRAEEENRMLNYIDSPEGIYDHQTFEILRWFFERASFPERLITFCRHSCFDANRAPWLRAYGLAILGSAGSPADIDRILSAYTTAESDLEKAQIVEALKRMELSRRNSFYGKIRDDSDLVRRAVIRAQSAGTAQPK
ncbi:MAG: RNA-directed DNA polymerase [Elusimicrobia bacterium]|nr:RNA-directed DNA polymerase [Elusimicrobiota bacterium]